jgi:hypothetical protein
MIRYIKEGFRTARSQTFVLLFMWLYQFLWGYALLLFVRSITVPLLHRYPGEHLPSGTSQLFLAEAQFRLMKTDISHSYLWLLLAFAAARMLITPVLNAGIYYSIHHPELNTGYRFFEGIRRLGKPFFGLYLVQLIFMLAPLYWIFPIVQKALFTHSDAMQLAMSLLPWLAAYAGYGYLVHLCFMYLLLGRTTDKSIGASLLLFARKIPAAVAVSLFLLFLWGIAAAASLSVSLLWAGISALFLQQLFHFLKLGFRLLHVSSQYHLFTGHESGS